MKTRAHNSFYQKTIIPYLVLSAILSISHSVGAQLETVNPKERLIASVDLENGWHPSLKLGANLSFGSNSNVIGQTSGDTTTLGLNVDGGAKYRLDRQEWRHQLNVLQASTRTPTIPRYIKSADELKYETTYLYGLESHPWLGPYAKASAETSILRGEDARDKSVTYAILKRDSSTVNRSGETLRLTDGFRPLTTKESVGFFAKLLEKEKANLEARVGVGAVQVQADGQFAVRDESSTAEIEVQELASFTQVGAEVGLGLTGQLDEKTSYSLTAEALVPFEKSDDKNSKDRDQWDLANIDIKGSVKSKIYDWATLAYELKVKRQPELLDEYQIQHLLVLNFAYTLL